VEEAMTAAELQKEKEKEHEKIQRMRHRDSKVHLLFYPEDSSKENWDMFITLILLVSCVITPLRIAFGEVHEPLGWELLAVGIDVMFLIDILVLFNSAFYDSEFQIVENRKTIAKEYIKSWFLVDLLAIIPFELVVSS